VQESIQTAKVPSQPHEAQTLAAFWLSALAQRPPLEPCFFLTGKADSGRPPRRVYAHGHSLAAFWAEEFPPAPKRVLVLAETGLELLELELALALLGAPSLWVPAGLHPQKAAEVVEAFQPDALFLPGYNHYRRLKPMLKHFSARQVVCAVEREAELQPDDQLTVLERALTHGQNLWRLNQAHLAQQALAHAPDSPHRFVWNPQAKSYTLLSQAAFLRQVHSAAEALPPGLSNGAKLSCVLVGAPWKPAWWTAGVYQALLLKQPLELTRSLYALPERMARKKAPCWLAFSQNPDAAVQRLLLTPRKEHSPHMALRWRKALEHEHHVYAAKFQQVRPHFWARFRQAWRRNRWLAGAFRKQFKAVHTVVYPLEPASNAAPSPPVGLTLAAWLGLRTQLLFFTPKQEALFATQKNLPGFWPSWGKLLENWKWKWLGNQVGRDPEAPGKLYVQAETPLPSDPEAGYLLGRAWQDERGVAHPAPSKAHQD